MPTAFLALAWLVIGEALESPADAQWPANGQAMASFVQPLRLGGNLAPLDVPRPVTTATIDERGRPVVQAGSYCDRGSSYSLLWGSDRFVGPFHATPPRDVGWVMPKPYEIRGWPVPASWSWRDSFVVDEAGPVVWTSWVAPLSTTDSHLRHNPRYPVVDVHEVLRGNGLARIFQPLDLDPVPDIFAPSDIDLWLGPAIHQVDGDSHQPRKTR